MNFRHPSCLARQLLRLPLSQPHLVIDSLPSNVFWRAFTSSAPRKAETAHNKGLPTPRISAERHSERPRSKIAVVVAGLGLLSFTLSLFPGPQTTFDAHFASSSPATSSLEPSPGAASDGRDPNLPRFRIAEIRKHGSESQHPWVIHGDKVYDITEWISAHPGGQVILRAAGGSIEPYWDIFTIHKNQYVYDILAQYMIGYVDHADLVDGKPAQDDIEDPFINDPKRHPSLLTRTAKPRNAETPEEALSAHFLTPNELFYVRNHMWVPNIEEAESDAFSLTVELLDGTVKQYTLRDLKTKFPRQKITAALQCSGNRRSHMSEGSGRKANGLPWSAGAISNASWEGVRLSDVLADAGFDLKEAIEGSSETQHVQFLGAEAYGASIPIKKAVDPQGDVLLAYGMNDEPLPRDHGFPLRAIVPGHVAARSVKWLNQITLSSEESTSQWQRKDYKCFGPNQTKVDWDTAPSIQEMPVQSAITSVQLGKWFDPKAERDILNHQDSVNLQRRIKAEKQISLSGYAYSGGGRAIIRVDVSLDGGISWNQAYLLPDCTSKDGSSTCYGHGAWSWKRWRYEGSIPVNVFQDQPYDGGSSGSGNPAGTSQKRCTTIVVKATDDAYNTQPESHVSTWNIRGNLASAWHRMQVCSSCPRTTADSSLKEEDL